MSYQGSYELVVGQQQAFQNIQAENFIQSLYSGQQQTGGQLLYPGLHSLQNGVVSNLVHPASHIPSLLQTQRLPTTTSLTTKQTSSLQPQTKKFRAPQKSPKYIPKPIPLELGSLKTYSNPDILICGNCRELFDDLVDMLDHKKNYCKMRFTCKCEEKDDACSEKDCGRIKELPSSQSTVCDIPISKGKRVCLRCSQCKQTFTGAWDLMFHVQNAHGINIYNLEEKEKKSIDEDTVT